MVAVGGGGGRGRVAAHRVARGAKEDAIVLSSSATEAILDFVAFVFFLSFLASSCSFRVTCMCVRRGRVACVACVACGVRREACGIAHARTHARTLVLAHATHYGDQQQLALLG
jgi:hypothetical protein